MLALKSKNNLKRILSSLKLAVMQTTLESEYYCSVHTIWQVVLPWSFSSSGQVAE